MKVSYILTFTAPDADDIAFRASSRIIRSPRRATHQIPRLWGVRSHQWSRRAHYQAHGEAMGSRLAVEYVKFCMWSLSSLVFYTGSGRVGKLIAGAAAKTLSPSTLEVSHHLYQADMSLEARVPSLYPNAPTSRSPSGVCWVSSSSMRDRWVLPFFLQDYANLLDVRYVFSPDNPSLHRPNDIVCPDYVLVPKEIVEDVITECRTV